MEKQFKMWDFDKSAILQQYNVTKHTLKPLDAAIWAAVQPSLSAWLIRSAETIFSALNLSLPPVQSGSVELDLHSESSANLVSPDTR